MDAFDKLRKNRDNSLEKIQEQLTKHDRQRPGEDDRFWKLERDQAGNAEAVIRFLPPIDGEVNPAVTRWSHAFQGPGGWYIDNCRTTLGEDCPVCDYNKKLYNSGVEEDKKTVTMQKRKQRFFSNIYVVSDPNNPENEGKVFLFEYGPMIHDMIKEMYQPKFDSDPRINVFDLWEGANFRMRVWTKGRFPQYDRCKFDTPGPLADDDQLREIYASQYPLQEFVSEDKFKSYEQQKERLARVIGQPEDQNVQETRRQRAEPEPQRERQASQSRAESNTPKASDDDDFDADSFFDNLDDLDDDIPF